MIYVNIEIVQFSYKIPEPCDTYGMFSSDFVTVGDLFGLDVIEKSEESELLESLVEGLSLVEEFDPKAASKSALIGLISESSSIVLVPVGYKKAIDEK